MTKIFITLFSLFCILPSFAQSDEGTIVNYTYQSASLGEERQLKIFLPIEYEMEPTRKFPVVYLLDGQNETLFNLTKSTLDFLIGSNEMEPSILVGIISKNRQYEFLPKNKHKETLERYPEVGGATRLTESFKNEIFPYIQKNYRTTSTRLGIGHSLGGTFLTQTLVDNPNLFNGLILISPNYAYDNEQTLPFLNQIISNIKQNNTYLYAISGNVGDLEKEFNPITRKVDSIFKSKGLKSSQWSHRIIDNYNHSSVLLEGIHKGLIDYTNHFDLTKINSNGYAQLGENNFEKAIEIFQRGVDLYPEDSNIYDSYGEAKEKSGDLNGAKALYALAIEKLKDEKEKYSEKEYLRRSKLYKENINRVSK